jgi:hypothetical protein
MRWSCPGGNRSVIRTKSRGNKSAIQSFTAYKSLPTCWLRTYPHPLSLSTIPFIHYLKSHFSLRSPLLKVARSARLKPLNVRSATLHFTCGFQPCSAGIRPALRADLKNIRQKKKGLQTTLLQLQTLPRKPLERSLKPKSALQYFKITRGK